MGARSLCVSPLFGAPLYSVCAGMQHVGPTEGIDGLMVHIDTIMERDAIRLSVRGDLDISTVDAFDEALGEAVRVRDLVEIDLARVDFIDGSGLSSLMDAEHRARRARHRLRIVAASGYVRRLIDITKTSDRLSPVLPATDRRPADRS